MPPTEGPPDRNDESQRLTYKDLGATKPYDWAKEGPADKPAKAKVSKKRLAAGLLTSTAVLLGAQLHASNTNSEVDPIEQTANSAEAPKPLESEYKRGDVVTVLAQESFQFNTNDVNVRTSPARIETSENEEDNEADTSVQGKGQNITVLHAAVLEDERNPDNGDWYGFIDADGKTYWVNSGALEAAGVEVNPATQTVTVEASTTNGVIARNEAGDEATIATAVISE